MLSIITEKGFNQKKGIMIDKTISINQPVGKMLGPRWGPRDMAPMLLILMQLAQTNLLMRTLALQLNFLQEDTGESARVTRDSYWRKISS